MKKYTFFLLIWAVSSCLVGQNKAKPIQIFLKDWSVIKCESIDTLQSTFIKYKLSNGDSAMVSLHEVIKIKKPRDSKYFSQKERTKLYYSLKSNYLGSRFLFPEDGNTIRSGLGLHFSVGYRLFPLLSLGIGTGFDGYETEFQENMFLFPIILETRGLLFSENNIPITYNLQIGYSFSSNPSNSFRDNGGALIYPNVGILIPISEKHNLTLDLGYKFQYITRNKFQWWLVEIQDQIWMKSLSFRAGFEF